METRRADGPDQVTQIGERGRLQRPFLLQDPEVPVRRARLKRVTVTACAVLLLIVVAAAMTRMLIERRAVAQGYVNWMRGDLDRLRDAQERFRGRRATYGMLRDLGRTYVPSQGVTVRIRADSAGWSASAVHVRSPVRCIVSGGIGPSALVNLPGGEVRCH